MLCFQTGRLLSLYEACVQSKLTGSASAQALWGSVQYWNLNHAIKLAVQRQSMEQERSKERMNGLSAFS